MAADMFISFFGKTKKIIFFIVSYFILRSYANINSLDETLVLIQMKLLVI